MDRAVYQIAGASVGRSYADVFLKSGVVLIPPGDGGPWSEDRYAYDFALSGFVRRFAEEMRVGDLLLLRTDKAAVSAVGVVATGYLYLDRIPRRERLGSPTRAPSPMVPTARGVPISDAGLRRKPNALLASYRPGCLRFRLPFRRLGPHRLADRSVAGSFRQKSRRSGGYRPRCVELSRR